MIKINSKNDTNDKIQNLDIDQIKDRNIEVETEDTLQNEESNATKFNKIFKDVYNRVISAQEYADWAEYYDEDGLVIMTTQMREDGSIEFDFGEQGVFVYNAEGFDKVTI